MKPSLRALSQILFVVATVGGAAACGGSSSSSPDAGSTAPDGNTTPDGASTLTIGNGSPVCQGHESGQAADVGPNLPSEIGDPAVARITPPSYPFKVTSVSYRLTGMETTCGTNIAHAVAVYAGPGGSTPPTTPSDVQRIPVAADTTDEKTHVVTAELPTPITLTTGQDLFVAVEMDANEAKTVAICLDGCLISADDTRNYWSEQTMAPFTWDSLYGFGIQVDYAIWATGVAQ